MTPSECCTRIRQLLPDRPCRPTEPPDPEKGESTSALGVSSQSIGSLPAKCPQCPSGLIRPTSSCERRGIELIRSFDSARGIRPPPDRIQPSGVAGARRQDGYPACESSGSSALSQLPCPPDSRAARLLFPSPGPCPRTSARRASGGSVHVHPNPAIRLSVHPWLGQWPDGDARGRLQNQLLPISGISFVGLGYCHGVMHCRPLQAVRDSTA